MNSPMIVRPGIRDVLRPRVAPQAQAAGDVLAKGPHGLAPALANGFKRHPAIAELCHVPADEVVAVVIDRPEPARRRS